MSDVELKMLAINTDLIIQELTKWCGSKVASDTYYYPREDMCAVGQFIEAHRFDTYRCVLGGICVQIDLIWDVTHVPHTPINAALRGKNKWTVQTFGELYKRLKAIYDPEPADHDAHRTLEAV